MPSRGPITAAPTGDQLRRLAGPDKPVALQASHELWCGLRHQHAQIGSAALPALPFLLEVLGTADQRLTVELLDILLGFAIGSNRRLAIEFHRSLGREAPPEERWVAKLRSALVAELPHFRRLAGSPNEDISDFAGRVVAELTGR